VFGACLRDAFRWCCQESRQLIWGSVSSGDVLSMLLQVITNISACSCLGAFRLGSVPNNEQTKCMVHIVVMSV
jgi:hypothetical protein